MQDLIIKLLNTDTVTSLVIGTIVAFLAKWFVSQNGDKFKKYEGLMVTAIKAAEKLIPDDTTNKGAARADKAMKLFIAEYERVTGVTADEKIVEAAALALPRIHAALESNGNLTAVIKNVTTAASMLLAACLLCLQTGCASMTKQKIDAYGKIADSYYTAPNVAELWVIENTNTNQVASFEVKNFTRFAMNTPVPPKNIIPREPTFWEGAWDTVKTLGPWAFFGYAMGGGGLGSHSTTTINNAAAATP